MNDKIYSDLFMYFLDTHGLILTNTEISDIVHKVINTIKENESN